MRTCSCGARTPIVVVVAERRLAIGADSGLSSTFARRAAAPSARPAPARAPSRPGAAPRDARVELARSAPPAGRCARRSPTRVTMPCRRSKPRSSSGTPSRAELDAAASTTASSSDSMAWPSSPTAMMPAMRAPPLSVCRSRCRPTSGSRSSGASRSLRQQAVGMVEQVDAFLDEDVDQFQVQLGQCPAPRPDLRSRPKSHCSAASAACSRALAAAAALGSAAFGFDALGLHARAAIRSASRRSASARSASRRSASARSASRRRFGGEAFGFGALLLRPHARLRRVRPPRARLRPFRFGALGFQALGFFRGLTFGFAGVRLLAAAKRSASACSAARRRLRLPLRQRSASRRAASSAA